LGRLFHQSTVKTLQSVIIKLSNFDHQVGDLGLDDINMILKIRKQFNCLFEPEYSQDLYLPPKRKQPLYQPTKSAENSQEMPTENTQKKPKKEGCYIATAVYGTYDCPNLWVLRRFRDNYLSKKLLGKLFIKVYYKISPLAVKIFGKSKLFNSFFKKILGGFVSKLKSKGYEDTPYGGT
jgi:hypothetical protein